VDNHIKKLRKAIVSCGCSIETVRKSGYRLGGG
jgi:Response regulators consisting of a CheY-like receiver domain and a winged-helix DNA-binding domain